MNNKEKNIFEDNLSKCEANYQPLSPITFLKRTADTFPNKKAIIYENTTYTYDSFFKRCNKI